MGSTSESATRSLLLDGTSRNLNSLDQMINVIEEQERVLFAQEESSHFPSSGDILKGLSYQKEKLEHVRMTLREMFDTLAKPTIRPIQITNVPSEIWVQIFEEVRGSEVDDMGSTFILQLVDRDTSDIDSVDTDDDASYMQTKSARSRYLSDMKAEEFQDRIRNIQNIRLTCRMLCEISSHLLIPSLYVEMQPHSLARLEEISRHPTIGAGVRTVRALLHYYEATKARDIGIFGACGYAMVESVLGGLRNAKPPGMTEKRWRTLVDTGEAAAQAFHSMYRGGSSEVEDEQHLRYQSLLRRAHEEYRSRFEAQEALRSGGHFSRRVAAAMARMPFSRRLEFHDIRSCAIDGFEIEKVEDDDHLFQMLLLPTEWYRETVPDEGEPPIEIIPELPVYLHRAGIQLDTLTIDIQISRFTGLMGGDIDTAELSAAMQGLETFRYRPKLDRGWMDSRPTDFNPPARFLRSVLDTASIRRICWEHQLESPTTVSGLDIGPVLTFRLWPKLESLSLQRTAFHLRDLRKFLRARSPVLQELHLKRIYLLSGTWAEVLDVLRAADVPLKSVWCPSDPEGEAINLQRHAFVIDNTGSTPANRYISGVTNQNPLVDIE